MRYLKSPMMTWEGREFWKFWFLNGLVLTQLAETMLCFFRTIQGVLPCDQTRTTTYPPSSHLWVSCGNWSMNTISSPPWSWLWWDSSNFSHKHTMPFYSSFREVNISVCIMYRIDVTFLLEGFKASFVRLRWEAVLRVYTLKFHQT